MGGYIYIVELCGRTPDNPVTPVYKIGKTEQEPNKRFGSFHGANTIIKKLVVNWVDNIDLLEQKFIEELQKKYDFLEDWGNEWFLCDNENDLYDFAMDLFKKYHNYKGLVQSEEGGNYGTYSGSKPTSYKLDGVSSAINTPFNKVPIKLIQEIFDKSEHGQVDFENKIDSQNWAFILRTGGEMPDSAIPVSILENSVVLLNKHGSTKDNIQKCTKIAELFNKNLEFIY